MAKTIFSVTSTTFILFHGLSNCGGAETSNGHHSSYLCIEMNATDGIKDYSKVISIRMMVFIQCVYKPRRRTTCAVCAILYPAVCLSEKPRLMLFCIVVRGIFHPMVQTHHCFVMPQSSTVRYFNISGRQT